MPPNSDSVPLIAIYYFVSMLIISLATGGMVLSIYIIKKGDLGEPVSRLVQLVFFGLIARVLLVSIKVNKNINPRQREISIDQIRNSPIKSKTTESLIKSTSAQSILLKTSSSFVMRQGKRSPPKNHRLENFTLQKQLQNNNNNNDNCYNIFNELVLREADPNTASPAVSGEQRKLLRQMRQLNVNLERMQAREAQDDYKQEIKNQWKALAKVIDILMLYAFIFCTNCMFAYLIRQVPYKIELIN